MRKELADMPTISNSSLTTWRQCPRRWWLTKRERVPEAPSADLIFGIAVHAAIEADGVAAIAGQARLSLPVLLRTFSAALDHELVRQDPDGLLTATRGALAVRGLATLRAYVDAVQPCYVPAVTERSFSFPLTGLPGWSFTGRIDAAGPDPRTADGSVTIFDFKTANKPWWSGDEHKKEQATAYLWADQTAGLVAASRVTFIVLATPSNGAGGYTPSVEWRDTTRTYRQLRQYRDEVVRAAREVASVRAAEHCPPQPSTLCAWCGVRGSCPSGQAYLAETGYAPVVPAIAR
jgi:CRISPR/Cas system-associated exonuclease Cas4 (RecB family)